MAPFTFTCFLMNPSLPPPEDLDEPALPPGLAEALRESEGAPRPDTARDAAFLAKIPEALAEAKRDFRLARQRRIRRWGAGMATAAAVGLLLLATVFRAPAARRQTGDIRDAFALACAMRDGRALQPSDDANRDGKVDQRDVDALAQRAVALQAPAVPGAASAGCMPRACLPSVRQPAHRQSHGEGRLLAFDIQVDPHGHPLACWQVEIKGPPGLSMVTAEGATGAFVHAPWYDPSASQSALNEVKLANFSLANRPDLAAAMGTVATLHVYWEGMGDPKLEVKLQAATDDSGHDLAADATAVLGGEKP